MVFLLQDCLRYKLQVIIYIHHPSLCFIKHGMVLHCCLDFSVPFPSLSIMALRNFCFQGLQRAVRMKSQELEHHILEQHHCIPPKIIKHPASVLGKITFCFRLPHSWELYFTLRKYFTAFVPRVWHQSDICVCI